MRVTKAHIGMTARFVGYDDKVYFATIMALRNGIVKIEYPVQAHDGEYVRVTAWLGPNELPRLIGE
jgi:hypothetical protein